MRNLIDCNQNTVLIDTENPIIAEHFNNPRNYADKVLDYFNAHRMYDPFLHGKKNLTILDLGANIGLFSLYAKDSAKLIVAVEPDPEHFGVLRQMTRPYRNIIRLHLALNCYGGMTTISTNLDNTTMNSIINSYGNSKPIICETLENLLYITSIKTVDFAKCDIEGAEMITLTEVPLSRLAKRIKEWVIEVHPTPEFSQSDNVQMLKDLLSKFYSVEQLNHETLHAYT